VQCGWPLQLLSRLCKFGAAAVECVGASGECACILSGLNRFKCVGVFWGQRLEVVMPVAASTGCMCVCLHFSPFPCACGGLLPAVRACDALHVGYECAAWLLCGVYHTSLQALSARSARAVNCIPVGIVCCTKELRGCASEWRSVYHQHAAVFRIPFATYHVLCNIPCVEPKSSSGGTPAFPADVV
jgi:hypothetical protein